MASGDLIYKPETQLLQKPDNGRRDNAKFSAEQLTVGTVFTLIGIGINYNMQTDRYDLSFIPTFNY